MREARYEQLKQRWLKKWNSTPAHKRYTVLKPRRALRKRFSNGMIVGLRHGEWWIGARRNFHMDWVEIGLLGLTWIIPNEFWWNRRNR